MAADALRPGPTFICGCGHSGTSIVAAMFASHPQVYVPLRETGTFLGADAAAAWAELRAEASASGRPYLAEKTPRHVLRIGRIRRLAPGARFLVVVRDGRDVAASFVKRYGAAAPGVERWLVETGAARRAADAPDVMILRYEDLIAAPEATVRRACASRGSLSEMLRHHETPRLWFGVQALRPGTGASGIEHRLLRNWQINQPLFDGRGRWRDVLTPADLALFETGRARKLMRFFGYA